MELSQNDLPYQVTCAKCGLVVTLYAPVEKSDGSRELVCLECLLAMRRVGWPPSYETKVTGPQECKCGDCDFNEKEIEMTKRNAKRIEEALQYFTPAALGGGTIFAEARALAVQHNPKLEAAWQLPKPLIRAQNKENWQAWVYGSETNPKS